MWMNMAHPAFDLQMELLCTLSSSVPASLKTLAADLGYEGSHAVNKAIRSLTDAGFQVCTARGEEKSGNFAYIERNGRAHADAACEQYWQSVYASAKVKAA